MPPWSWPRSKTSLGSDLRHTFASWLMMRSASLRSVAELLGHQSLKMTMRYAHLSPAFLSAEVNLRIHLRRRRRVRTRARKQKGQEEGKRPQTAILPRPKFQILLRKLAPQAGLEPATLRLTEGTAESDGVRRRATKWLNPDALRVRRATRSHSIDQPRAGSKTGVTSQSMSHDPGRSATAHRHRLPRIQAAEAADHQSPGTSCLRPDDHWNYYKSGATGRPILRLSFSGHGHYPRRDATCLPMRLAVQGGFRRQSDGVI